MRRIYRKRLAWVAALVAFPVNMVLGDWHFDHYGGHPWKRDVADRLDERRRGLR